MASVAGFTVDLVDFQERIERWDHVAEATRHLYFVAARRIQAWIRGILTRNHFRLLHESAVIVQRHWRGYRARTIVDRYLIERVHQTWQDHYDRMATRIQALWRGYWIRRTVLDIRKMRRWLDQVYAKNEETVRDMKKLVFSNFATVLLELTASNFDIPPISFTTRDSSRGNDLEIVRDRSKQLDIEESIKSSIKLVAVSSLRAWSIRFRRQETESVQATIEQESMQWILVILFKLHHLLRTAQRPGVLTRIDDTKFTFIEEMLKCLEYKRYIQGRRTNPKEKCRACQIDAKPSLILRGTYYERCEREIREVQRSLEAEVVPIFRSEPFEEQEKSRRRWNEIHLRASIDQAYERESSSNDRRDQDGGRRKIRGLRKELKQEACCVQEDDLCREIQEMDCHLDQLRLRCPIHDPAYST